MLIMYSALYSETWYGIDRSRADRQKERRYMKADKTTKLYKKVFDITENHFMVNRTVKAVIINFGDDRGDIIVKNDNFGTRRKYADFTNGKKEAGLHPLQIVFFRSRSSYCIKRKIYRGR